MSAQSPRSDDRYVPLFWRLFLPNAVVLAAACIVLIVQPANGRVLALAGGLVVMLAVNMFLMRRAAEPLASLTSLMREVDPLRPGQRIPAVGPQSEVTLVTSAFNDMLDRIEYERRESARREIAAQEADRRQVAAELHDHVGQTLTGMVFALGRAIERAPDGLRPELEELRTVAADTIEDVRRLAALLRPEVLDTLGLVAALTNLCERFASQTGLRVTCAVEEGLPELTPEAQHVVYRVAQEGLTNAARHGGATRIAVRLWRSGDGVELALSDNGVGLPVDLREGGGIRGMRERALLIGGELRFAPSDDGGAEVRLLVASPEIAG